MTERAKKALIIIVCAVLSIALIAGIVIRFGGRPSRPDTNIKTDTGVTEPKVDIDVKPPVVDVGTDTDVGDTDIGAISTGTEQQIQSEPVKPTATPSFTPTQEQLDSGEVPTTVPEKPVTTEPPQTNEQGQVYFPGFGYVTPGGPGTVDHASDMYENGNKVGIMD